ncbi:hypothetical protein B879_02116 [Cecembia lonarensis LW9]|uniref:Uncharacterized protein n=2 Tax=Cecembia TaxID=1187078 RepID=K1KYR7_CECL9|nr:hypothetical protein B879_02116 [Cecembia lonarensis LW9]
MNLDVTVVNHQPEIITLPDVKIDKEVIAKAKECIEVEKQVIVHVSIRTSFTWWQIRIWPSTFLVPRGAGSESKLLNADNIPFYPQWLYVFGSNHRFTLIFEGLPEECEVFDLIERIPQKGGFEYFGIRRNRSDVYHIELD